jgi:pilus assembly protein Flp/PilA
LLKFLFGATFGPAPDSGAGATDLSEPCQSDPFKPRRIIIMSAIFSRFVRDDSGATAIEYGLIAGLIAVVVVTAVTTVGTKLTNTFTNISNKL